MGESSSLQQVQPLPEELIESEILPWLPVKSLFRFKSVCKRWYSLFSLSTFVNLHLSRCPNSLFIGPFTDPSFFHYESFDPNNPNSLSESLIDASDYIVKSISISEPIPVGSCHGLVCFNLDGLHYFISNPAIRKSIRFRGPPYRDSNDRDLEPIWGFGHVSSSDDYKIVLIFSRTGHYGHRIHIFSRNEHSWSSLNGLEFDQFGFPSDVADRRGVFVNDHAHWKLTCNGNVAIVGFKLGPEKMKVIPMPNWESSSLIDDAKSVAICALGGCLCLCRERNDQGIEIWMMKEHGEANSWAKIFSLSRTVEIADLRVGDCEFFGFTEKGKFLMHTKEKLMLVDPYQKPTQYTTIMASPGHLVSYLPSLVSPFSAEALERHVNQMIKCISLKS